MSGGGGCCGQAASGEDLRRRQDFVFFIYAVRRGSSMGPTAGLCFFIFMKMIATRFLWWRTAKGSDCHALPTVAHGKGR
jgi:hypothetical protein